MNATPATRIPNVQLDGVEVVHRRVRECSDAGSALRLMRPTPHEWHGRDTCARHCPTGGRIAQCARAVRLHSLVHCRTAAPSNVCKTSSSSSDLLFVLALLPVVRPSTSRRMAMSVHAILHLHAPLRLCHASPHAVWHSLTGHHVPASSSQSGRAVPLACH